MRSYDGSLLGATRDASSIPRPNTRSPKQVHVAVNVQILSACGVADESMVGDAACDPGRMPLDMSVAGDAETWPLNVRCQRRGCASRWPAYRPERGDSRG